MYNVVDDMDTHTVTLDRNFHLLSKHVVFYKN